MQNESIQDLEVLLGHSFRDKGFLLNALSHSSIKTDNRPSNERLEFLGDSVLGLIVSDALYRRYPEDDEGTLTRIKSQAVSRSTLQRIAVAMGLDRHILVGKGVAKREIPASLLGNLFEAIVGAIYLDAGLAASRKFILRHLDVIIGEIVEDRAEKNYKSMLQHYCQREMGTVPGYRLLREAGPSHHRTFDVAVLLNGREFGRARGDSKKEAEQGSAQAALLHFRAVNESANQTVRGAGTVLSIGPYEGGRRGRRDQQGG
ncbi:MAG: ribonuclease III, partial [Planctomycetes bacterium]|nr:ribonuclease III [Planctomycetota bacterium]